MVSIYWPSYCQVSLVSLLYLICVSVFYPILWITVITRQSVGFSLENIFWKYCRRPNVHFFFSSKIFFFSWPPETLSHLLFKSSSQKKSIKQTVLEWNFKLIGFFMLSASLFLVYCNLSGLRLELETSTSLFISEAGIQCQSFFTWWFFCFYSHTEQCCRLQLSIFFRHAHRWPVNLNYAWLFSSQSKRQRAQTSPVWRPCFLPLRLGRALRAALHPAEM